MTERDDEFEDDNADNGSQSTPVSPDSTNGSDGNGKAADDTADTRTQSTPVSRGIIFFQIFREDNNADNGTQSTPVSPDPTNGNDGNGKAEDDNADNGSQSTPVNPDPTNGHDGNGRAEDDNADNGTQSTHVNPDPTNGHDGNGNAEDDNADNGTQSTPVNPDPTNGHDGNGNAEDDNADNGTQSTPVNPGPTNGNGGNGNAEDDNADNGTQSTPVNPDPTNADDTADTRTQSTPVSRGIIFFKIFRDDTADTRTQSTPVSPDPTNGNDGNGNAADDNTDTRTQSTPVSLDPTNPTNCYDGNGNAADDTTDTRTQSTPVSLDPTNPTNGNDGNGNAVLQKAAKLRPWLKIVFNSGLKWKKNTCHFRFMYCFVFFLQIIKVALITHQMFHFAHDRGKFSSVVNRGDLVLRHLLLEHWDASWETLPYPRAQGDFAVYTINELENGINYAVKNFYNAEREAIGYYIRTADDKMTATIKHFDFPGFHGNTSMEADITISEISFPIEKGLMAEKTVENETIYSYNITREFEYYNISHPFKRMLSTILYFKLHSVRSHEDRMKGTCLRIEGSLEFADNDNNGQVLVDLKTSSKRIICKDINLLISDWQLQHTTVHVGASVIILSFSSIVLTVAYMVFVLCTFCRTKQYMNDYYKNDDLPTSEYCRFLPFWDIITFLSDICTLIGTFLIVHNDKHGEWLLEELDSYIMMLGLGSLLAWLSLLRFFEFYTRFNLLFRTIYISCPDIITYLICVSVLFVGFLYCGYIVMAPYHVKFKTPSDAAETLFSIINGDEIYTTLALLESEKSGGYWVRWFSRLYVIAFVAIFTVLGINLFIALFLNAYESIKKCQQGERESSPIRNFFNLALNDTDLHNVLYKTMKNTTNDKKKRRMRKELSKFLYIRDGNTKLELTKNKTLQEFIMNGKDEEEPLCEIGSVKCNWSPC